MIPLAVVRLDTRMSLSLAQQPPLDDPAWTPLGDGLEGVASPDPSRAFLVWDAEFLTEGLSALSLFEQREYLCQLPPGARPVGPFAALWTPLAALAGAPGLWLLATRNRVGSARLEAARGDETLFSVPIEVRARKLDHLTDLRAMLDALARASLASVLSPREAPTELSLRLSTGRSNAHPLDRYFTLRALARGGALDEAVAAIAASPLRGLEASRRVVPLAMATRVRTEDLAAGHGPAGADGLPARVTESRPVSSLDTPENRFVNTALDRLSEEALALSLDPRARPVSHAARGLAEHFDALARRLPFRAIGPLASHAPVHSAALQRRDGYREFLALWTSLDALSLRPDRAPWTSAESLRDFATLYERWCGLELARCLGRGDDGVQRWFGSNGVLVGEVQGRRVELVAQRTFTRMDGSYSLALRPDYTLGCGGRRLVFDAKYQLQTAFEPFSDGEPELTAWASSGVVKMHAYRDAIEGVWGAWAIFPGREARGQSFEAPDGGGTGALPLSPSENEETQRSQRQALRDLLARFVTECDRSVA